MFYFILWKSILICSLENVCSKYFQATTGVVLFHQPTLMHNCALKLVDEIILYYDARSKKYQITEVVS